MALTTTLKVHCGLAAIVICLAYHGYAYAFADEVTGYYTNETNQCPEAIGNQKKSGKWSGVTITPIQISFVDGAACSLSDEEHKENVLYMKLTCLSDSKRSGTYRFDIHDNQLVMARKNERQTYVRCGNLALNTSNDMSAKGRTTTGVDVGGGANVRPYANNNSMRMKMSVPFP